MSYPEMQKRADQIARNRENRGRIARVSANSDTTGTGTFEIDERIDFGLIFVEKPHFTYGSETDPDDLRNMLDLADSDLLDLPQASAYVTAWDIDTHGHYVGAWCAVCVAATDPTIQIAITWHFAFTAIAIKDFPVDLSAKGDEGDPE